MDWSAKIAQARAIWPPETGYFLLRLVPRGWAVPCQIIQTTLGWQAEIDGNLYPEHPDPAYAPELARIWHGGRRISATEYRYLLAVKDHARAADPDHPALHPHKPMDPRLLTPIQPRTPHPWIR